MATHSGIRATAVVHATGDGQTGSELAAAAARQALADAGLDAKALGVIVDFSVMPQQYLVPAWNMSNRLQDELGAKNAFTLGFSGNGATGFHTALSAADALLRTDDLGAALLVAADLAIPGNRAVPPDDPLFVLGDGASALVLQADAPRARLLDVVLWSDGARQGVCMIPGGALAEPDREDRYRLTFDRALYDRPAACATLRRLADGLLARHALGLGDVACFLFPNVAEGERAAYRAAFEADAARCPAPGSNGHLHGSDFVANLAASQASGAVAEGGMVLMASHGWGAHYGVTLLRA